MADCDVRSEKARSRLSRYTPGSFRAQQGHRFTKVCIQLFGMTGHGKSSLINSCSCVMRDDDYLNMAGSGKSDKQITMERKEYQLSDCVFITDNRGVAKLDLDELHEMTAQMSQLRNLGSVEFQRSVDKSAEVFLNNFKNPPSEILLPVFVYSAAYEWSSKRNEEIEPFLRQAFQLTGIFPVIALTRCSSPKTRDIRDHFRSLGANFVVPIENYTSTDNVKTPEKDEKILKFLKVCLMETDRSISLKMHNDPREQILRQFVREVKGEIEDKEKEIEALKEYNQENEQKNKRKRWPWFV